MKQIFKNPDPTPTEQEMFRYAGFYKIEDDMNHTRYVPVHTEKHDTFPAKVDTDQVPVEYSTEIVFYHMAETTKIKGMFDSYMLNLIQERMKELKWK